MDNASNASSREAEMTAGSAWTTAPPNEDATNQGRPYAGSTADDAPPDQSTSGSDNNPPPAATATSVAGSPLDGILDTASLAGIGDAGDLGIPNVQNLGNGDASALQLVGTNGGLQPVFGTENAAILDFHADLESLSHETGSSDIVHGLTATGETAGLGKVGTTDPEANGATNLVTDAVNLPGTLLRDGLDSGVSHIGSDLTNTVNSAAGLVSAVPNGNDASNPVPELVNSLGGGLQTLPILTVDGGNNANDGGLLGSTIGDLNGSSSGHLISADAGPQDDNGLGLNVLATPDSDTHTAGINALDVGPSGPQLVDAGVLTDASGLNAPMLNDLGLQDLTGTQTGDLLTVNGGNNADDGGLIGGIVGGSNGSAGGHLIDADAGPNQDNNSLDVLAVPTGADHTADASVIDVGPNGPHLADLGVLTDPGTINIPTLNGAGTDGLSGLTGSLLGGAIGTGAVPAAPVDAPTDLGGLHDILPGSITGDHGIIDVNGHHIV